MENVSAPEKMIDEEDGRVREDSISKKAVNFEDSSFVSENKSGKKVEKKPAKKMKKEESTPVVVEEVVVEEAVEPVIEENNDEDFDNSEAEAFEAKHGGTDEKKEDEPEEETEEQEENRVEKAMEEIAEQPFEVAMENLEVTKAEVVNAARGVFGKNGYFEMEFSLPFGENFTLRSKSVNDYVDYNSYVRRLLLEPISQKEYDTFTQMRNLSYAMASIDGEDIGDKTVEEKFEIISALSEIKITAIINVSKKFWRVTHLLLHPKAIDFFSQSPEV